MIDQKREESEKYIREHKIQELFEDLCTSLAYKRPKNINEFLIQELTVRKQRKQTTLPIFNEEEVENIYNLYNLKQEQFISKGRAIEALKCIAHSTQDVEVLGKSEEIPDEIDMEMFKHMAQELLGINFQLIQ